MHYREIPDDARAIHQRVACDFPGLGEEVDAGFVRLEDARRASPPRPLLAPPPRDEARALRIARHDR